VGGGQEGAGKYLPWPGDWKQITIEVISHHGLPVKSGRDQVRDFSPRAIEDVLEEIENAFMDT
jgi:hypothetical protein